MTMASGKVFLTNGELRATLAVARSLGRRGIRVVAGSSERHHLTKASRYCYESRQYPSPRSAPRQFVAWVGRLLQKEEFDLLVPMDDVSTILISREKEKLSGRTSIPIPDHSAVEFAGDKSKVLKLASHCGVPIPRTYFVEDPEELEGISREIDYPAVIKSRVSRFFNGTRWIDGGTDYVSSPAELMSKYAELHQQIPLPLVQEKIVGDGYGVFLLFDGSEAKAAFSHRRIREKPPWGGVSVMRESVAMDETMERYACLLLERMKWQGVAMVEFKVDDRDGVPRLMEINGRFWGSLQLAIDSGVDFPYLLYKMIMSGGVKPLRNYRVGTKTRWFLGDVDSLLQTLFSSPDDRRRNGRLKILLQFLRFWGTKYEIFSTQDLMPGVVELYQHIGEPLRRRFRSGS